MPDHSGGPGAGIGTALTRCPTRSIRASFHCKRCTCQTPRVINPAHSTAANSTSATTTAGLAGCGGRSVSVLMGQGRLRMSIMSCTGIMLVFRLYITQIDPASMINTNTAVNSSASMDQPPSTRVFMCRK